MPDISTEVAIASQTLGSAAATITFSSISSAYTDIRVVVNGTPTGNTQFRLRFNNDSGANYSGTEVRGNGSSIGSDRYTSDTGIYSNWAAFATSAQPVLTTFDVFSYTGSTNKTVLSTFNQDTNGSGTIEYGVGLWRSTSAINRIDLTAAGNSFNTGTIVTLYGIL